MKTSPVVSASSWYIRTIGDDRYETDKIVIISNDTGVSLQCGESTFSYLIEKNENVLPSVRILLQHVCMKVPDKSEYRSKVAQVGGWM